MIGGHPYRGKRAVLATRHDKLPLVAPQLAAHVGLEVVAHEVDTDSLGTFTGDRPRTGSQRDVCTAKARLGIAASGLHIGIASEGSFGPLEGNPFINACLELVMLVDDDLGVQIGEAEVDYGVPAISVEVRDGDADAIPLEAAGFPDHGLIVRPDEGFDLMVKGIHDLAVLQEAVTMCTEASPTRTVRVENDLRAHHSPSRRDVIARASERLARRLAVLCSRCAAPGWGVVRRNVGAPCYECGTETRMVRSETYGCERCDATATVRVSGAHGVDPRHCPRCNP